jgi:hypothetical protein
MKMSNLAFTWLKLALKFIMWLHTYMFYGNQKHTNGWWMSCLRQEIYVIMMFHPKSFLLSITSHAGREESCFLSVLHIQCLIRTSA